MTVAFVVVLRAGFQAQALGREPDEVLSRAWDDRVQSEVPCQAADQDQSERGSGVCGALIDRPLQLERLI